jgi:phosphoribosylformimino-5-aminoimidazole carboxamide ribotide isomerase
MDIIPAVDIKGGKCVRLRQGERLQEIVYSSDPVLMASKWADLGAKLLHIVDLDGAWEGKPRNFLTIKHIASRVNIPLQVGGGIRDIDTIERYLSLGIKRIILGTGALKSKAFIEECSTRYPDKILLSIDTKQGYLAYDGWRHTSTIKAAEFVKKIAHLPLRAFIFTDTFRDGMLKGPNINAIEEFVQLVNKPVIAAGGITNLDDIMQLIKLEPLGLEGIILGRALYEGTLDLREVLERADVS